MLKKARKLAVRMFAARLTTIGLTLLAGAFAQAAGLRAEVLHWWTSGGESVAVRRLAEAYRGAGGEWVDSAIAGSEQARAIAMSRGVGGDPPTGRLFNTCKRFL